MPGKWRSKESQDEEEARRVRLEILDQFWSTCILNRNQRSIDNVKSFIKGYPPEKWNDKEISREQWSSTVDSNFQSIQDGNLDQTLFLKLFEHLSDGDILEIDKGEGFGIAKQNTPREEIITPLMGEDEKDIAEYMDDSGMSAVASLGAEGTTTTLCTNGNDEESIFSIHSVGKIFTGMLVLSLVEQGVLQEEDLNKPIQISESAKAKLPASIVNRLAEVTLHDVMVHKGGFGDFVGNYAADVKSSLEKTSEQPKIEDLEDFLLYGNGCGLIKIASEQENLQFDEISPLLKNRNGIIFHKDNLFYVDQNRKSIEPIVVPEGKKEAQEVYDFFKTLLSQREDNICQIATPEELERVTSLTGRTHSSEQLSAAGTARYSNLGSLLVGLAVEHAYAEYQKQHAGPLLSFNDMLREFIQKPAGMAILTDRSPEGAKVNTSTTIPEPTPEAPHLVANPSGGYWTNVSDLRKLGEWLYQKCHNPDFGRLVETYGQEFHLDHDTLGHKGENPSASAMLSVSLRSGRVIAVLSNSSRTDAHVLEASIRKNVFSRPVSSISPTDTHPPNLSTSPVEQKKMPGEWAQQDLIQKSAILQTLYGKIDDLSTDDKEGLIGFLAACLVEKPIKEKIDALKGEVDALFGKASNKELTFQEFENFFKLLKPLDAKLLPFNCEALGINPWPNSQTAQHFPEQGQDLLEEYMIDSDISAALSFRNAKGQSIDIASSNVYPIHSVAKVFTGVMVLMMVHEKPDGENSILPVASLDKPIKELLSTEAWHLLAKGGEEPSVLQTHLEDNHITLRQVMTHKSGLGDYGYDSGTGTYRDTLESGEAPVVSEIRDFLQFTEDETYPVGKFHYSNLGITLAGLAVENAYKTYQDTHPELLLPPLNFFGMLKHYVLDPANMAHFFESAPKNNAAMTVQTNPNDKAAPDWVGGPAGGYWTTTDDLVKFGQWLHAKCQDPTFRTLVELHGTEFYKDGKIMHPGNSPYASAFFFVDLESGNTAALGSTDNSGVSLGLELTLGTRVFPEEKTVQEDLGSVNSAHASVTKHYKNSVGQIKQDGEVTADTVVKETSSITPFQITPKPSGTE